jgi:hypothetical protein
VYVGFGGWKAECDGRIALTIQQPVTRVLPTEAKKRGTLTATVIEDMVRYSRTMELLEKDQQNPCVNPKACMFVDPYEA